jgi:hypothetical protein
MGINTVALLTSIISTVCPLVGMGQTGPTLYPAADGSLWRIDFDLSATPDQQQAAIQLLLTTNPTLLQPMPSCLLWQVQAVLSTAQWAALQTAIANLNSPVISAFFSHPGNEIPADSTTVQQLGAAIGLTNSQIITLVQQANAISIP